MKRQGGFTLMELIIVIVILGILSAFAVPKYMSLDKQARAATVKALHGSIMAASEMVHGVALAKNVAPGADKDLGHGLIVSLTAKSYPTAANNGIGHALTSVEGFSINDATANTIVYKATGSSGNCTVTYKIEDGDNYPFIDFVADDTNC